MATGSRDENADPAPARVAEVVGIEAVVEPEAPPAPIVGPLPKAGSRNLQTDRLRPRAILNVYTLRWATFALIMGHYFCVSGRMLSCVLYDPNPTHDSLDAMTH